MIMIENMDKSMEWWSGLSSIRKTQFCDTHDKIVGNVRRWETLTDLEIFKIYNCNCIICQTIK